MALFLKVMFAYVLFDIYETNLVCTMNVQKISNWSEFNLSPLRNILSVEYSSQDYRTSIYDASVKGIVMMLVVIS